MALPWIRVWCLHSLASACPPPPPAGCSAGQQEGEGLLPGPPLPASGSHCEDLPLSGGTNIRKATPFTEDPSLGPKGGAPPWPPWTVTPPHT